MPEIEMDHEDYLSMIKNPLEVGAVRIHMDPERIDTFWGFTTNTFEGEATLFTSVGPLKMDGT